MKKLIFVALFLLVFSFSFSAHAQQTEKDQVQQVIEQLFDGMRASDSSMVRQVFSEEAIMQTIAQNRDGNIAVHTGNLDRFVNAVGAPKNEKWDERIGSYNIQIDDNLASVWTPYSFYLGDTFSHCGVNSFQLYKSESGWKIFHIVDTRRKDNCY